MKKLILTAVALAAFACTFVAAPAHAQGFFGNGYGYGGQPSFLTRLFNGGSYNGYNGYNNGYGYNSYPSMGYGYNNGNGNGWGNRWGNGYGYGMYRHHHHHHCH